MAAPSPARSTYLAPGQRYVPTGTANWRADRQFLILMVGRDLTGSVRVAYRCPDGNRVIEPVAQFEAAVATGQLVPVTGPGPLGRC